MISFTKLSQKSIRNPKWSLEPPHSNIKLPTPIFLLCLIILLLYCKIFPLNPITVSISCKDRAFLLHQILSFIPVDQADTTKQQEVQYSIYINTEFVTEKQDEDLLEGAKSSNASTLKFRRRKKLKTKGNYNGKHRKFFAMYAFIRR